MSRGWKIGLMALVMVVAAGAVGAALGRTTAKPVQTRTNVVVQARPLTTGERNTKWFGPWKKVDPVEVNDEYASLLLLRTNGNEFISDHRTPVDIETGNWHQAVLPEIGVVGFDRYEGVDLGYDREVQYSVGWGQPFILEQFPARMYAFEATPWGYIVVSRLTARARAEAQ